MASKTINKLLKDAIADAEAVRETAMANAKLYLEEAITPDIQNMIARRLRVEADLEHDDMEDTAKLPTAEPKTDDATEKPFEQAEAVGSSEFPADTSAIGGGENKEPSADAFDTSAIGDGGENVKDSHTDWYDDWNESDFDLNEVIKELEEDIAALSEAEPTDAVDDEEEQPTPDFMKKHADPMAGKAGAEEPKKPTLDLEAILAELDDEDEEQAPMAPMQGDKMQGGNTEMPGEEDEEFDLDEILAELDAGDDEEDEDETHQMAEEIARLKNENAQYNKVVKILKTRLNEVNLLSAKLLFTNRLFRKEGLNTDQKVRIVESFDRATTVREVKLVYAALVENLSVAAKTFSASRKKIVAEGLASKPTRSTAPVTKEVIVENTVARRLQELAGIIS